MLAYQGTETDHAVAASQPRASGGGQGSGGLSERKGAGKCQFRGQRKAVEGNVRWRETKDLQQVETG